MADRIEAEVACEQNCIFTGPNSGKYTWSLNDRELVHKILNLKNGECYETEPFSMAKLIWTVKIYSNGELEPERGNVRVCLNLKSLPSTISQITCSFLILCNKTMASKTGIDIFATGDFYGFTKGILRLSEWKTMKLSSLEIMVSVNINSIQLTKMLLPHLATQNELHQTHNNYKRKSSIKYEIGENNIDAFTNCNNGKQFDSPICDNMWILECHPNGLNTLDSGYLSIYLRLVGLPPYITQINAKFSISCNETDAIKHFSHKFRIDKPCKGHPKFMQLFNIKSLRSRSVTFIANIEISDVVYAQQTDRTIYDAIQINHIISLESSSIDTIDNKLMHHESLEPASLSSHECDQIHDSDEDEDINSDHHKIKVSKKRKHTFNDGGRANKRRKKNHETTGGVYQKYLAQVALEIGNDIIKLNETIQSLKDDKKRLNGKMDVLEANNMKEKAKSRELERELERIKKNEKSQSLRIERLERENKEIEEKYNNCCSSRDAANEKLTKSQDLISKWKTSHNDLVATTRKLIKNNECLKQKIKKMRNNHQNQLTEISQYNNKLQGNLDEILKERDVLKQEIEKMKNNESELTEKLMVQKQKNIILQTKNDECKEWYKTLQNMGKIWNE